MRLLPKGTLSIFTGRKLPCYEPDFRPSWLWTSRFGRVVVDAGKIIFPLWPTATNRIVCGSTGVGKSTLIYEGLRELADAGVYEPEDLAQLDRPTKTEKPSRFTLEREGILGGVDSWIDIKGEDFTEAFGPGAAQEKKNAKLEAFLKQVNAIVMVITAQQLLDIHRRRDKPSKWDRNLIDGFTQRINQLHPGFLQKYKRLGFNWHLVINQCADVLDGTAKRHTELVAALRHFSDKTGFHKVTPNALLCDCKPAAATSRGLKLAGIGVGPKGGLNITRQGEAKACSAGVAMGIILGRIRHRSSDHHFIVPLKAR